MADVVKAAVTQERCTVARICKRIRLAEDLVRVIAGVG